MAQRVNCGDPKSPNDGVLYSAGPNVAQGGTSFKLDSLKCPVDPYADGLVFQIANKSAAFVNGADTLLSQDLSNTKIVVDEYEKQTIILNELSCEISPIIPVKINYNGKSPKAIGIFPTFDSTLSEDNSNIEWAFDDQVSVGNNLLNHIATVDFTGLTSSGIDTVTSIVKINGIYYIGTLGGLIIFDGVKSYLKNTLNSKLGSDYITSIDGDLNGTIYIGTQGGFQTFVYGAVTEFSDFYTNVNDIVNTNINVIKFLDSSRIFIGTSSGLSLYNLSKGTFTTYTIYNTENFIAQNISSIAFDSVNSIAYLGHSNGVLKFDYSSNLVIENFNSSTSGWSAPNTVQSLYFYNNILYVGTYGGLVTITTTSVYTTFSGSAPTNLLSTNIRTFSLIKSGDTNPDRLIIGHIQGASIINLNNGNISHYPHTTYPVFLTGVNTIFVETGLTYPDFSLVVGTGTKLSRYKSISSVNTQTNFPDINFTDVFSIIPSDSIQYSVYQNFSFGFSKPIDNTILSNIIIKDDNGNPIVGTWSLDVNDKLATFSPTDPLTVGKKYTYSGPNSPILNPVDNSVIRFTSGYFWTEDLVPIFGWNPVGKINIFSASTNEPLKEIWIRNPRFTKVKVDILLGF